MGEPVGSPRLEVQMKIDNPFAGIEITVFKGGSMKPAAKFKVAKRGIPKIVKKLLKSQKRGTK